VRVVLGEVTDFSLGVSSPCVETTDAYRKLAVISKHTNPCTSDEEVVVKFVCLLRAWPARGKLSLMPGNTSCAGTVKL